MPLIPQEVLNALSIILLCGLLLPALIEYYFGEPPIFIKIGVTFGMIILPALALVYNLSTWILS